jgi:hypothetical protein
MAGDSARVKLAVEILNRETEPFLKVVLNPLKLRLRACLLHLAFVSNEDTAVVQSATALFFSNALELPSIVRFAWRCVS